MAVGYFPAVVGDWLADHADGTPDNFSRPASTAVIRLCDAWRGITGRDLNASPLTLDAHCETHHPLVSFQGARLALSTRRWRRLIRTAGGDRQPVLHGRSCRGYPDLLTVLPRRFLPSTGMQTKLLVVRNCRSRYRRCGADMVWHRVLEALAAQRWLRPRRRFSPVRGRQSPLQPSDQ